MEAVSMNDKGTSKTGMMTGDKLSHGDEEILCYGSCVPADVPQMLQYSSSQTVYSH